MDLYEDTEIGALILKCREHDDEAFRELVRRYTPMMKKVISGFLDTPSHYDELFVDACVALHSAMRTFDVGQDEVTFGLYARTCVHNKIVDTVRVAKSGANLVDFNALEVEVGGPEVLLMQKERFEMLMKRAAAILSEYEYKVLMLYIQGYSTAVISETLGRTPKSVDNAKSRLFTRLRSEMAGELDS